MNLFSREKPDGRRTAGYLVYLLGGLAAAAAIMVLHRRVESGQRAAARNVRGRGGDIAPITQAASAMSPVKVAGKTTPAQARSYRLDPAAGRNAAAESAQVPSGRPSFDAIGAALKETPGSAAVSSRPLDVGGAEPSSPPVPQFAPLPPAFPAEASRGGQTADSAASGATRGPTPSLLGYRDPAADPAGVDPDRAVKVPADASKSDFLPRGTLIAVYLLTTVDTSNPAAVIQFGAARNVVFNRRRQLAFGTRFLGRLSGRPMRDRLNLAADTVLFPDGFELPVSASAVEADEAGGNIRPGVAAACFPPPAWAQAAPYLSDLFTGFTGLLESRAERPLTLNVGGVGVQTSAAGDLSAPLEQASAQAIRDFTLARLKEVEDRYALYYLVAAGTAFWLQLDADLDLDARGTGRRSARPVAAALTSSSDSPSHASDTPN